MSASDMPTPTWIGRLVRIGYRFDTADPRPPAHGRGVAIVASRLGDDPQRRGDVCRWIGRLMLDYRGQDVVILIAAGSAIQSLAVRGAELYGVPHHLLRLDELVGPADRDQALIAIADSVEAVHVRRGGKIHGALLRRLADDRSGAVRVVVGHPADRDQAAIELIAAGAVGRWTRQADADPVAISRPSAPLAARAADQGTVDERGVDVVARDHWSDDPGGWLIHCTRGNSGPWPGQSERSAIDDWLLWGDRDGSPLQTLRRIVTMGRLVASAVVSDHRYRVVCFSATSLVDALSRRCYRPHVRRWDGLPYGIAIRRSDAIAAGAAAVIYGEPDHRDRCPEDQRFRFQPRGAKFDWRSEREYRFPGDVSLRRFAPENVRVFVPTSADADRIGPLCPWSITVTESIVTTDH